MYEDPDYDVNTFLKFFLNFNIKKIEAVDTLVELIDNNRLVLQNKISSNLIDAFISGLIKTKQIKFIKLLRV